MAVYVVSQQYKNRQGILFGFIVGNLLNAVHMLLLGAIAGTVLAIIGSLRFAIAIYSMHRNWLYFFLLLNTVITYYVFEGYLLSLTSYAGATCIIVSSFLKSDHWMRVAMIFGGTLWMLYGILVGSIIAVFANALFVISSIIGWYRHVHSH